MSVGRIEISRTLQVIARQQDPRLPPSKAADRAVGDQGGRLAAGDIDREQRMLAIVVGGRVERLAIGRYLQADPANDPKPDRLRASSR